jgi:hypothetical protein
MTILHLHRLNRILGLLAVLVLGSLTAAPAAYAATLTVCPSGCDFTTIQPAIDGARSGDTIRIFSGVYGVEPIAVITDKSLVLEGVGATVLDCSEGSCEVTVQLSCSQSHQITIKRLTITNAAGTNLTNNGCKLRLIDSVVIGSYLFAIEHRGLGTLTMKNSEVSGNNGGIRISAESKAFIINSTVNNSAGRSQPAILNRGTLHLYHSTVSNNSSSGGIANGGTLIVKHSSIVGNSHDLQGAGGIENGGVAIIADSLIASNIGGANDSLPRAGGILNSGKLTLIRSTVQGNLAFCATCDPPEGLGGGIYNKGDARLIGTLVTRNIAGRDGGGVFNDGGTVLQTETLITSNTPNDCVGC